MYRYPAFPAFVFDLDRHWWNWGYEQYFRDYATTQEWWEQTHQPGQFVLIQKTAAWNPRYSIGTWEYVYSQCHRFSDPTGAWAICPVGQDVIIAQSRNWQ